jgi:hypothetical protein
MASKTSEANAAVALADLFFHDAPKVSDAEKLRANELRKRYRDWRTSTSAVPHFDVLAMKHEDEVGMKRSGAKMKRVKTVGARLQDMPPVRRHATPARDTNTYGLRSLSANTDTDAAPKTPSRASLPRASHWQPVGIQTEPPHLALPACRRRSAH